jgi:hypothetical protein
MTLQDLSPLENHLWQSTLRVLVAWVLTLALRENRAAVRHWIWFAASVKFLVPFSLLVSVGALFQWRTSRSGPWWWTGSAVWGIRSRGRLRLFQRR